MTKQINNHCEFIEKPAFPIVGKVYKDSIDWLTNKVDPYSLSSRHKAVNEKAKKEALSNKKRKKNSKSKFNTEL